MRDILQELGVNFNSHSFSPGLEYAISDYNLKRERFCDALSEAREAFTTKTEAIPVKSFINHNITPDSIYGTVTDQFVFWQEIKDFIKNHENESWKFSHFQRGVSDLNTDPYEDFEDFHEYITVYAYIQDDEQPKTEQQNGAIFNVKAREQELIYAKRALERELKNENV